MAKGCWNMIPRPTNCLAMTLASLGMDSCRSHATYDGFEPIGSPSCSAVGTGEVRRRALGRRWRGRGG